MRVVSLDSEPFAEVLYLDAARGGGTTRVSLPLFQGRVSGLPAELDALVAAADLQGRESCGGRPGRLLGERLAEELVRLANRGLLPAPDRTGILLGGDLYTVPLCDRRGKCGDVEPVWRAFAERFRWVAGVVGNHDNLGGRTAGHMGDEQRTHLLDGNTVTLDGLRVGGVGGIVGAPTRLNRKEATRFNQLVEGVLARAPDVLICHEGPDFPPLSLPGNASMRELLEVWAELQQPGLVLPLLVCGHSWWPEVMVELAGGIQVLKVDARVVVLSRARE
ncbi:MAG TPA: metallophosphoesterase [Verrucomicrobiota bacterium]|nr:metallophosphoesterase [Verrucomicrobiota bacterium]